MSDAPISTNREHVEEWLSDQYEGYDLDDLARTIYQNRAQRREPLTDEEWARIKDRFAVSVGICRADAIRMIDEGELE